MISKIRTRKLAVTITLVLMISSFANVGVLFVNGAATSKFPVEVVIDNGDGTSDTLRLADHTSNADGNWISLIGADGTTVTLPSPMVVELDSSVDSRHYNYQGKVIDLDTAITWPKTVTYPLSSHKVYHSGDEVEIQFTSNNAYDGDIVELRLLQGSLNGLRNIYNEALDGNIQPIKDYVNDREIGIGGPVTYELNAGNSYTFTHDFGALDPASYLAVVLIETDDGTDYSLDFYSATPIEVFDYALTVDPSFNEIQENLEVEVTVEGALGSEYSYGSVLVSQDIYSLYTEVNTDGSVSGTTVDVGVDSESTLYRVVENELFLGVSLDNYDEMLSQSFWQDVIVDLETAGVIPDGKMAMTAELHSSQSSLTGLDALILDATDFTGTYWLMTVVWEHGSDNIAAFDQQEVTLGEAISVDSINNNLPQNYAEIIPVEFTISSSQQYVDAVMYVSVDLNGVDVEESDDEMTFTINSGSEVYTYSWDSLRYMDKADNAGGSVEISYEIRDAVAPGGTILAQGTSTGTLDSVAKSSLSPRVSQIVGEWVNASPTRKAYLSNLVNKIVGLWVNAP